MFTTGRINHPCARGAALLLFILFTFASPAFAKIPYSEDACRRLSEGAKITNTKALIIGYEGLFSSSPINANLLSSYRESLATGKKARRPLYIFGGSFLTRGPMTRIVEKYKNRVQILMFGRHQTSASSIPGKCATIWMSDKGPGTEGRKVIIVGHSFGGAAAYKLAKSLRVNVDAVVTADPRDPICMGECFPGTKPSNVTVWSNHYQLTPLRGHKVGGAQNHYHARYSHGTIQNAPAFYQAIANRIDGVSGPLTVDAPTHTGEAGRTGTFDPSSISGLSAPAGTPPRNPIPEGGQTQGTAAPIGATNSFLASAARASPSRSRAEEERWFNRASVYESTGGSGTAKAVPMGDGVVRYYKPGGGPPENNRGLSMSGASMPGSLPARSLPGGAGGSGGELSDSTTRAGSSSTGMLNKLWPLSKVDGTPSPSGGGSGFNFDSGASTAPTAGDAASASNSIGPDVSSLSEDSGSTVADAADSATSKLQAPSGVLVSSSASLFRRVHLKHQSWFKRKDRF